MNSWYPDRSVPSLEEYQDRGGRGYEQPPDTTEISRKSSKIVRRKHPTVDPRGREAFLGGASEDQKSEDTLDPLDPFLEAADNQIRPAPSCGFCRWQEKEMLLNYACTPKQNHYSMHYREVSLRGRRQAKGCPRFQDLPDAGSYIEAYRPFGYTSICTQSAHTIPARSSIQDQNDEVDKSDLCSEEVPDAPKEKQISAQVEERFPEKAPVPGDRERRTRSYLHELAMRLGVRESLRDYYFMTAILPSPPSITRNRQIDFVLCATKNSNTNGNTTVADVDSSEEQGSLECKLSSSELPPIPAVPKLTRSSSDDNSNPPRFSEPQPSPSTPKKGEPSRETILLRTAQTLGLTSRKWSSRKHDRPSEAGSDQGSTYVSVSKGSAAYNENCKTSSLEDVPPARTSRHNSSRSAARSPASGEFVSSQEKRREDSAPPPNRKPHSAASQFTSAMRPQKLSRARRKLTAALNDASTEQDKPPPPQINGILGIQRHRLIPPYM